MVIVVITNCISMWGNAVTSIICLFPHYLWFTTMSCSLLQGIETEGQGQDAVGLTSIEGSFLVFI